MQTDPYGPAVVMATMHNCLYSPPAEWLHAHDPYGAPTKAASNSYVAQQNT